MKGATVPRPLSDDISNIMGNATRIANFKTFDELMGMALTKKMFKFISLSDFKMFNDGDFIPHYIINGIKGFSSTEFLEWVKENLVHHNAGHKIVTNFTSYPQADKKPKDVPNELIGIKEKLKELGSPPPCVYFLIDVNEIVYVGQSINVYNRIATHNSEKKKIFTRVLYIPVCEDEMGKIERHYINSLDPKYNTDGRTVSKRNNRPLHR